jgi:hypothetical protein
VHAAEEIEVVFVGGDSKAKRAFLNLGNLHRHGLRHQGVGNCTLLHCAPPERVSIYG